MEQIGLRPTITPVRSCSSTRQMGYHTTAAGTTAPSHRQCPFKKVSSNAVPHTSINKCIPHQHSSQTQPGQVSRVRGKEGKKKAFRADWLSREPLVDNTANQSDLTWAQSIIDPQGPLRNLGYVRGCLVSWYNTRGKLVISLRKHGWHSALGSLHTHRDN